MSCTKWEWSELDGFVPFYLIKSASSDDGVHWDEEGIAIEYKTDHEAIARPWLIEKKGKYYMWYSYRDTRDFRKNKDNAYMLGLAISESGKNWIRQDELVGIEKSQAGWDSEMMCYSRACLKNHSSHLYAPLCVIFMPNSGYIARYAPFIWHKSPTNCDAHLTESIFQTRSSVIQNGDEMVLFYNGNEHGKYALGYATCKVENFYNEGKNGILAVSKSNEK